jgi:hypothetical protein
MTTREFYSLLRATIKRASSELLINDQILPNIMGKMPTEDWKQ